MSTTNEYEVVVSNGDRAEAETLAAIVVAARTICAEARTAGWTKPTATFLRGGRCFLANVAEMRFPRVPTEAV